MRLTYFLYYAFFVLTCFLSSLLAIYLVNKYRPVYLEYLLLKSFRKHLYVGLYVKLEGSPLLYKIVRIHDNYVQLYHNVMGTSGHPRTALYPADYVF